MGDSVDNYTNATESDIMIKRQMIRAEFYNTYDVMTGIRIASTLGGFFLMMVLLVLYKSKCKTRSLSDQHLEAVIKAAVDQEEQLAALAKRSSSSSYCSGHGLCRCSPRYSMTENNNAECNNWNRKSKTYLSETQCHPYSALPQTGNKFMKSSVLEYSFEEDEDDDMEDMSGNNGYRVAKWLEVPGDKKWIPRGNSAITVSSNDTSYLEARGSSLFIGHPPSPLNHPPPAGDPPWEFYYPIDIQVIQPTPCATPDGVGSQESFSDVPRHTEQLLPAASERYRKPQHHARQKSPTSSSATTATAPIAFIRTSCSSCSDDGTSTATTVNSSVFADDCCCGTTSPLLPPPAPRPSGNDSGGNDCYDTAAATSLQRRKRYAPPPTLPQPPRTGNRGGVVTVGAAAATAAVRSFHDFNRRLQQPPATGGGVIAGAGRNVIVVQADVNPIADSIVNANSLSGSLRALYDASKETLF